MLRIFEISAMFNWNIYYVYLICYDYLKYLQLCLFDIMLVECVCIYMNKIMILRRKCVWNTKSIFCDSLYVPQWWGYRLEAVGIKSRNRGIVRFTWSRTIHVTFKFGCYLVRVPLLIMQQKYFFIFRSHLVCDPLLDPNIIFTNYS